MSLLINPIGAFLTLSFLVLITNISAEVGKLVCFYDSKSFVREGETGSNIEIGNRIRGYL